MNYIRFFLVLEFARTAPVYQAQAVAGPNGGLTTTDSLDYTWTWDKTEHTHTHKFQYFQDGIIFCCVLSHGQT